MRVELTPPGLSVTPGKPSVVTVKVTNTGAVISGHELRVLGLDPSWVRIDHDQLSLFPDATGEFAVTVQLPVGLPAGTRRLEIEVRELTPPNDVSLSRFELTIPAEPNLAVSLDPMSVTGGRNATVGVRVENTGNSLVEVHLEGKDQEGQVFFEFSPPNPSLAPGEQVLATASLRARRRWFGGPKIRPYTVEAGPARAPSIAFGAWVQRPRVTRGNLALFGLLAAATVFAVVISAVLSQVVSQSNASRDLALEVAEATTATTTGGSSAIAGTVSLIGVGTPIGGVTVDVYSVGNPSEPLASTATDATGGYRFGGLGAGDYKLSYDGAGFIQLWYPESLGPANAGKVTVGAGQKRTGVNVHLGGEPATVSGQVIGTSTAGAVLTLEVPGGVVVPAAPGSRGSGAGANVSGAASTAALTASTVSPTTDNVPEVVTTQTLPASGDFVLAGVPSPAIYEIVVSEQGYAPATQEIDLGGGENRTGVTIELHVGDGSVRGTVSAPKGPLGGATISATDGTATIDAVTATTPSELGTFILANLPTPSTLTLTVSAAGYASQTISVSLAPAQQVTGIAVSLAPGVGSISGTVTTPAGAAVGGVNVSASDGSLTVTTATLSSGTPGSYTVSGLPIPGSYTVTFSRPDLASQTQQVTIPATGVTDESGVDISMSANMATVSGVVADASGSGVSEVAISLVSGAKSYNVVSATLPTAGAYEIGGILPGTYDLSFTRQGGVATSLTVHLQAGQTLVENETLSPAASIFGFVELASNGQAVPSAQVNLYLSSQYPTVVSATTSTTGNGEFTFANVAAPESYIVAVSYPAGSSPQETVQIVTSPGVASPACGSNATGGSTTSSSLATTTTVTESPTTSSSCAPSSDPLLVSVS